MTVLDSNNINDLVLVMSPQFIGGALDRLQCQPLLQGMDRRGCAIRMMTPESLIAAHFSMASCLMFVYEDVGAANAVREARSRVGVVICLCSDVYSFDRYVALHEFVDLYIAPTPYHQRVLSGQLYKPVYLLPECVDPIASQTSSYANRVPIYDYSLRVARGKRTCWFGHADSFNKSMASLMPVIAANLDRGSIQAFQAILNEDGFDNLYRVTTSNYSSETFWQDTQAFGYCILSHLSLDLSVNTFIKSPNKLITALFCGLVPLASDTPNYRDLMQRFGLTKFVYGGPRDLDTILRDLDPIRDWDDVKNSGIFRELSDELSIEKTASRFVGILDHWCKDAQHLLYADLALQGYKPPQPRFSYFARGLLPSAYRAISRRIGSR
jgi:hypothetical protein